MFIITRRTESRVVHDFRSSANVFGKQCTLLSEYVSYGFEVSCYRKLQINNLLAQGKRYTSLSLGSSKAVRILTVTVRILTVR